jgi:hypothetical protein
MTTPIPREAVEEAVAEFERKAEEKIDARDRRQPISEDARRVRARLDGEAYAHRAVATHLQAVLDAHTETDVGVGADQQREPGVDRPGNPTISADSNAQPPGLGEECERCGRRGEIERPAPHTGTEEDDWIPCPACRSLAWQLTAEIDRLRGTSSVRNWQQADRLKSLLAESAQPSPPSSELDPEIRKQLLACAGTILAFTPGPDEVFDGQVAFLKRLAGESSSEGATEEAGR